MMGEAGLKLLQAISKKEQRQQLFLVASSEVQEPILWSYPACLFHSGLYLLTVKHTNQTIF